MTDEYEIHAACANMLKQNGQEVRTLLDIGCSDGSFTKAWRKVFPHMHSTGIDNNYYQLAEAAYYCERVICATLSDVGQIVPFQHGTFYSNGNSYYPEQNTNRDFVCIPTYAVTLDELLQERFDAVKLDTQGSERDIILGGSNVIGNADIVVIETPGDVQINEGAPSREHVLGLLSQMGFTNQMLLFSRWENGVVINTDYMCRREAK